jgi:hypothetical protein
MKNGFLFFCNYRIQNPIIPSFFRNVYENSAEYPAIYGEGECGAGVWGMQSPIHVFQEDLPFEAGSFTSNTIKEQ